MATTRSALEHLCRLLVQFHDPALCVHADQHRVSLESWMLKHFMTMMSGVCPNSYAVLPLWDTILVKDSPVVIIFMTLALLLGNKFVNSLAVLCLLSSGGVPMSRCFCDFFCVYLHLSAHAFVLSCLHAPFSVNVSFFFLSSVCECFFVVANT